MFRLPVSCIEADANIEPVNSIISAFALNKVCPLDPIIDVEPEIFKEPLIVTLPDPLSNIDPVFKVVGPLNIAT